MPLPVIPSLRPDLVPHRQWALRQWYYASPLWYYHRRRTSEDAVVNGRFYELVDENLRPLCRLLYDNGLQTTPSCQGHFYPRQRFERIWNDLLRDRHLIHGDGLVVRDSETDRAYRFRDDGYDLPWSNFSAFHDEAGRQQGVGYIGILIPPDCPELIDRFESLSPRDDRVAMYFDSPVGRILGVELFGILVYARSPQERSACWSCITRSIAAAIKDLPVPLPAANGSG